MLQFRALVEDVLPGASLLPFGCVLLSESNAVPTIVRLSLLHRQALSRVAIAGIVEQHLHLAHLASDLTLVIWRLLDPNRYDLLFLLFFFRIPVVMQKREVAAVNTGYLCIISQDCFSSLKKRKQELVSEQVVFWGSAVTYILSAHNGQN